MKEIKRLITEEARKCCEGCEIDDPSQLHHECLMTDEEELWICHYDAAKKQLNLNKLWSAIEREILTELDVYLQDSWLKYLLTLLKVDETTAFLLCKDLQRRENEREDECLKLGCYEYM